MNITLESINSAGFGTLTYVAIMAVALLVGVLLAFVTRFIFDDPFIRSVRSRSGIVALPLFLGILLVVLMMQVSADRQEQALIDALQEQESATLTLSDDVELPLAPYQSASVAFIHEGERAYSCTLATDDVEYFLICLDPLKDPSTPSNESTVS